MSRIRHDAAKRPNLFLWNGALDRQRVTTWASANNMILPPGLLDFWVETGGGDVFETESIFGPFPGGSLNEDVRWATEAYQSRGVPSGWVVFHAGLDISAFRAHDGKIAVFVAGGAVQATFDSFDEWYERHLREEYAERYGLAP